MNERDLIDNWAEQKLARNYHRLAEQYAVEYEFTRQRGQPSSYAFVGFSAVPAEEFALHFSAEWPAEFDQEYKVRIQHVIAEAAVDALCAMAGFYPYRGCSLTLVSLGWDSVGSSEAAVYRATVEAMQKLRADARWDLVGGRYRSYV